MRTIAEEKEFLYKENIDFIRNFITLKLESDIKASGKVVVDEMKSKYIESAIEAFIVNRAFTDKVNEIVGWINKWEEKNGKLD